MFFNNSITAPANGPIAKVPTKTGISEKSILIKGGAKKGIGNSNIMSTADTADNMAICTIVLSFDLFPVT
jgi:hypothetical protein